MPSVVPSKPVWAPLLVALLMLPAACSDDSSSSASGGPSSEASSSTAPTAVGSPTDSTSPEPTGAGVTLPYPEIAPATGILLEQPSVEVRAPEGWTESNKIADFSSGAFAAGSANMQLIEQSAFGGDSLGALPLEKQQEVLLKNAKRDDGGTWELVRDFELDGVPVARVDGVDRRGQHQIQLSVERSFEDDLKVVDFVIQAAPRILERNPGLFESVLNTWAWH